MFKFTTKPSIAISNFSILLTTFANFGMNFKERHPEKANVVLIDYDLVAIMMPTTLAGAQIGALILFMFPSFLIESLLTLMLAFLAVQSTCKALEITKKENKERSLASVSPAPPTDANVGLSLPAIIKTDKSGLSAIVNTEPPLAIEMSVLPNIDPAPKQLSDEEKAEKAEKAEKTEKEITEKQLAPSLKQS